MKPSDFPDQVFLYILQRGASYSSDRGCLGGRMEVSQARYDFFLPDPGCTYRILRFPVEKLGGAAELGCEPRVATVWQTRFWSQILAPGSGSGTQSLDLEWFLPRLGLNRLIWSGFLGTKGAQCPAGMDLVYFQFKMGS